MRHLPTFLTPSNLSFHQPWSSISAGLVLGIIGVLTYLTPMAALVFSGPLEPHLATGVGIILFSAAVVGLVVALQSSSRGTIALPVPEEMAILSAIGASIAAHMPPSATADDLLVTMLVAIALTSILTGLFLFALGQLQLGNLIRFLPYPVIGGFLAGLGCLLFQGAFKVMTDLDLGTVSLTAYTQPAMVIRWLPGALFGAMLLLLSRRTAHVLMMPVSFLVATGLFYGVWLISGHTLSQASTTGWLLGPFPPHASWEPLNLSLLGKAQWPLIWGQIGSIVSTMLITALSLLMVSSGVELATNQTLNLNQELRATGLGCLLAGLFGGVVGSPTILTILGDKMAARSRLVGVVAALVYLGVLLAGISLIAFFPRPVLGGLLLFLGLDLLTQWLIDAWPKLPPLDYGIVVLIMIIIATVGLVEGVIVGLIVATVLFVVTYSRIDVAKHTFSGTDFSSHVQRSTTQSRLLRQRGEQIYALQLQGLLFFGTAYTLLKQIRSRMEDPHLASLQFVVLDFQQVNGLDSSAVLNLMKLKQMLLKKQIQLILTHLSPEIQRQLLRGGTPSTQNLANFHMFDSFDLGLAWCEEEILKSAHFRRRRVIPIVMQLELLLTDSQLPEETAQTIVSYMQRERYPAGAVLFSGGDVATSLYFIESGQISTWTNVIGTVDQRVQTAGPGTLIGDVEFITQTTYGLTAGVDQPTTLYRLTQDQLQTMDQNHPEAATIVRKLMTSLLAEQLAQSRKELKMLMR